MDSKQNNIGDTIAAALYGIAAGYEHRAPTELIQMLKNQKEEQDLQDQRSINSLKFSANPAETIKQPNVATALGRQGIDVSTPQNQGTVLSSMGLNPIGNVAAQDINSWFQKPVVSPNMTMNQLKAYMPMVQVARERAYFNRPRGAGEKKDQTIYGIANNMLSYITKDNITRTQNMITGESTTVPDRNKIIALLKQTNPQQFLKDYGGGENANNALNMVLQKLNITRDQLGWNTPPSRPMQPSQNPAPNSVPPQGQPTTQQGSSQNNTDLENTILNYANGQ